MQATGRRTGVRRPALLLAGLIVVVGAGSLVLRGDSPARGPISVPNSDATPIRVSEADGYPVLTGGDAPETLVVDTVFPEVESRLIWFQGRNTKPGHAGRRLAVDAAGGMYEFDGSLAAHAVRLDLGGLQVYNAAAIDTDGYMVVATTGELLRVDSRGEPADLGFAPFDYTHLTSGSGGETWAYRSSQQFAYRFPLLAGAFALQLNDSGERVDSVGAVVVPRDFMLGQLANAGHIVVADSVAYIAPFVRDQVVAVSLPEGDTLWVAEREFPHAKDEPRFDPANLAVDYTPVNQGIALGPDGLLYVLSVPEYTIDISRVDVFDPARGRLLRSATVEHPLPTIAVDNEGRVYLIDEFRLLTGVPPDARVGLADFELEVMGSDHTLTNDDIEGQVTLINFWASWCEPCKEEMPALDSLRRSITNPEFRFLSFNDDVNTSDAAEFIDAYGFDFPVLLGRGQLRRSFHFMGLPFTLLVDRDGNVVQRWIGFAGAEQLQSIRSIAVAELERGISLPDENHAMSRDEVRGFDDTRSDGSGRH